MIRRRSFSSRGAGGRGARPRGKRSEARMSTLMARIVFWSLPGARPRPRSMRPGCSVASVPNCSAMTSGEWFGSITPPAPSPIVEVWAATAEILRGRLTALEAEGKEGDEEALQLARIFLAWSAYLKVDKVSS